MAIDPYKPELAKRRTAFEMATEQLCEVMEELNRYGSDFRAQMEHADEVLKDYREQVTPLPNGLSKSPKMPKE